MTIDDLGRIATTELQDRAASDLDIDAALESVTARRPRAHPFAIPAIAVAIAALAAIFIWAQDPSNPDSAPPADSTPTQSTPAPDSPTRVSVDAFIVNTSTGDRSELPRHIARIPLARNFVASPDGSQIAFSDFTHLYVTTLEPGVVQKVSNADEYTVPAWSADGDRLVYTVAGDCFVIDLDTGERRTIISGRQPLFAPNFSPDGSTVLFTRRAGNAFGLWELDVDSGQTSLLSARSAWGFYSPDGSTVAFRHTRADEPIDLEFTDMSLSTMTVSGQDMHPGGSGGGGTQGDALAFWPSWAPSGALIANQSWHTRDLHIIDTSNGDVVDTISTDSLEGSAHSTWIDDEHLIVEGLTDCTVTVEC
jgi:Tol biopolymer transport system component